MAAFLVYDWIISIESEAKLIWSAPRSSASLLYWLNRSNVMLEWITGIVLVWPVSDKVSLGGVRPLTLGLTRYSHRGNAAPATSQRQRH